MKEPPPLSRNDRSANRERRRRAKSREEGGREGAKDINICLLLSNAYNLFVEPCCFVTPADGEKERERPRVTFKNHQMTVK